MLYANDPIPRKPSLNLHDYKREFSKACNLEASICIADYSSIISGNVIMTSGRQVAVTTLEDFKNFGVRSSYQTEQLFAQSDDGSTLALDASNGNVNTFLLTVTADGVVTALTLSWNDQLRLQISHP